MYSRVSMCIVMYIVVVMFVYCGGHVCILWWSCLYIVVVMFVYCGGHVCIVSRMLFTYYAISDYHKECFE